MTAHLLEDIGGSLCPTSQPLLYQELSKSDAICFGFFLNMGIHLAYVNTIIVQSLFWSLDMSDNPVTRCRIDNHEI